jgi:hypothetical protein
MRLRLVVRRHGMPEVKLVWNVGADTDFTVAKFASQVNDVLPLEGGEWTLKDYAVEYVDNQGTSFECLHFQQVGQVLKEDDQVL